MPWANLNGLKLHYQTAGQGARVLFIGGTGGDLRQRPGVLESPLAESCRVLAYDQRNLGQSDKPPAPCSMADYAEDAAALMAAVGWRRAAVVGFSFGGMVAQHLALHHPRRVERMALLCAPSGGAGGASYPLHELWELPLPQRARRMVELADTRRHAAWQAAHAREMEALVAEAAQGMELTQSQPGGEEGIKRQLAARRGHDTWPRLGEIAAPTLVCAGAHDGIAPLDALRGLAGRIPGARLEVFDGGHLFFRQAPRAWPTIAAFVAGG